VINQREVELLALNVELEDENRRLHAQLAAAAETNEALSRYANCGWSRVATLASRSQRLLRLAKYWKALCPTKPLSDHMKVIIMAYYAARGGLEHGKSLAAIKDVIEEFGVSERTVHRLVSEFKYRKITRAELSKLQARYRHRFGD
jgi:hypothetical protein